MENKDKIISTITKFNNIVNNVKKYPSSLLMKSIDNLKKDLNLEIRKVKETLGKPM